jgi:hypothetical protein
MLDAFACAGGNFDGAIVLVRGEFALHEHVSAFHQTVGQLLEAFAESSDVVPLRLFFPLVVLVFPGFFGRDRELCDGSAIRQILGFGVFADESDYRKLIEVHTFFLFCPAVLGHKNARLVAPKLVNVPFLGTAKFIAEFAKGVAPLNFVVGPKPQGRCAFLNSRKEKRKAERAQVPGTTGVG